MKNNDNTILYSPMHSLLTHRSFITVFLLLIMLPIVVISEQHIQQTQQHASGNVPTLVHTANTSTLSQSKNIQSSVHSNTQNGNCSSEQHKTCGFQTSCPGITEGTLCERNLMCNYGLSYNSVYQCTGGQWIYLHWTNQGVCNFCPAK